jgi:hypothetical protein
MTPPEEESSALIDIEEGAGSYGSVNGSEAGKLFPSLRGRLLSKRRRSVGVRPLAYWLKETRRHLPCHREWVYLIRQVVLSLSSSSGLSAEVMQVYIWY